MQSLNLDFLRGTTSAGTGPIFQNERYNLGIVQVGGTFVSLAMSLEGRTNAGSGPWEVIAGWNVSSPNEKITAISAVGIYEFPIEGVREFRFRILSISGGYVDAVGVLYDETDKTVYPYAPVGQTVTFGDPKLFVKGEAEQIFFDPETGNIIGYDKTATEGSVSITANLTEITGGMGNQLIGVLPDTVRISGTYTSAAFSLETRERIMGGEIAYEAVAQVCETITADSENLIVSGTPAPALGESETDEDYWCYVRHIGDSNEKGVNVSVEPSTGAVQDYTAEPGERYEVTYFAHRISAQMLPVPTIWNPVLMTVQQRYGVYSRQNGSAEKGILKGWLYFIVPRAILNADAGANASQGSTATTSGNWIALPEKPENMPLCVCDDIVHPVAYYVYSPCSGENDAVIDVVSVGNGLSLRAGRSKQLPVKLVMPDDSLIQPDFYSLNYYSENDEVATVNENGIVTGVSEGETIVNVYVTKSNGMTLKCSTVVSVEGTAVSLLSNPDHIIL